jgi:hypothetical protein
MLPEYFAELPTVLTILAVKLVWYAERIVTSVGDPAFEIVLLSLFGGNR